MEGGGRHPSLWSAARAAPPPADGIGDRSSASSRRAFRTGLQTLVDDIPPWIREQASESRGSESCVVLGETAVWSARVVNAEENRLGCPQVIAGWCVGPDKAPSSLLHRDDLVTD